jgi:hypothetical protein
MAKKKKGPKVVVQATDTEFFVIVDGLKIAQRGKPGTPQAKTWVSLEPDWRVWDEDGMHKIVVEHKGVRVH